MSTPRIVMLCGGVGGARAALALYENLPHEQLTFVVNSGDDFEYMGLTVWPDWDTVVYHLAGVADEARGWGRKDEGTRAMEEFQRLPGPHWFHLGDRDLALHVFRTWALQERSTTAVASQLLQSLGVDCAVLPATRASLHTRLRLANGQLIDFQDWFVREKCRPEVSEVVQEGLERADVPLPVLEALEGCELLLYAPSNPYLSILPMVRVPRLRRALDGLKCPRWAVSPLLDGKALKGPLDSLIARLGSPHRGQEAIAHFYRPLVDGLLLPEEELFDPPEDLQLRACPTLLTGAEARQDFVRELRTLWA